MATATQNRTDKIKLFKDLKYGKVHLRQSLLEMDEIEDLDRFYKNKKDSYRIEDREDIVIDHHVSEENEQEIPAFLSPIERLALYRKEKINKKIKDKMDKMWTDQPKNVVKLRKPKTEKILENFQQKFRKEMPISYMEEIKESEMNLKRIKKNDKFKFHVSSLNKKSLYVSRMHSEKRSRILNDESQDASGIFMTQTNNKHKRFMSLKTSLPEKEKNNYQSVREIVQGKNRDQNNKKVMDIKHLQNQLDSYLNKIILKKRQVVHQKSFKNDSSYTEQRNKSQLSAQRPKTQTTYLVPKKRTKSNAEKSIIKSEQSSNQILQEMSNFYQVKHIKKQSFDEMVENVKYDRPFTSSLRRKNYTLLGKQSLSPIQEYRSASEFQRKTYQQKNIQFYKSLLQGLQKYHEEDIPTTIFIIEQIKKIFESQYKITHQILTEIVDTVQRLDMDHKSIEILNKIGDFTGFEIILNYQDNPQ